MTIKDMHYDFKQKLNKIDSQQYRNLRVPEIDWKLVEAEELFIKMIAEPRLRTHLGFEKSQRVIDDIRTIVKNNQALAVVANGDGTYTATLPADYMFFVSAYVVVNKNGCTKTVRCMVRQHDDEHEESPFDNSSFEWENVNMRFYENGIKIFTDGNFTVSELRLDYIRRPLRIHNAEDFLPGGTYNLPDGTVLAGSQNSELPENTHREIVDLAVLIMTGDLDNPNYQLKQAKLNLNQF